MKSVKLNTNLRNLGYGDSSVLSFGIFQETQISEIEIPKRIHEIPDSCFLGCKQLKKVTMHDNIESIGEYAFYNSGLEKVTIPGSVVKISQHAFDRCENMANVEFLLIVLFSTFRTVRSPIQQ